MNRHPGWTVLGAIAAVPAGIFLLMLQIGMFGANGFGAGMGWLLIQLGAAAPVPLIRRSNRRRKRHAELAARADYEHGALARGDLETWMHGQFPPAV